MNARYVEIKVNKMTSGFGFFPDIKACRARIGHIRSEFPRNLMARHFSEHYIESLDKAAQTRVWNIIRSGIENPDSRMGVYAQNYRDYEDFNPLLEPMIRGYHGFGGEQRITQQHDWSFAHSKTSLNDIDVALGNVSMRVRVGRNLASFPLPGAMAKDDRIELERLMISAFSVLMDDAEFAGQYYSLTPGSIHLIDQNEYLGRVNAHQMFREMDCDPYLTAGGVSSDWPYGRGMYISDSGDFIIWVGEEDHLRIMSMRKGADLSGLFARLQTGLGKLEALIPGFAHSSRYGYITSCPSNLGTAMRASLHLELPNLTSASSSLDAVNEIASRFGISVRGVDGEHSVAGQGGIIDISPIARLGVTESEIMQRLARGTSALWALAKAH